LFAELEALEWLQRQIAQYAWGLRTSVL
jgi:hypothetical protein